MSFFIADEAHNLQIKYSQAVDYPVDLYYLMDLSKSMEDDKQHLSKLGDTLSSTMRNLTSNFRLGFGSFVDKVLMPYVSTVPKKWVIQLFLINFYLFFFKQFFNMNLFSSKCLLFISTNSSQCAFSVDYHTELWPKQGI